MTGAFNIRRDLLFASLALVLPVVYFSVTIAVFVNGRARETGEKQVVTNEIARDELKHSYRHDAAYFRDLAHKLEIVQHEPAILDRCYETAVLKGPADYRNFLEYAAYLSYQSCCKEKLRYLISETVKRAPNNSGVILESAGLLLKAQQRKEALVYLSRAIQVGGSLSEQIYDQLRRDGETPEAMKQLTPRRPDAMLNFAAFLKKIGAPAHEVLHQTLIELATLQLKPEQHIALGKLSFRCGENDLAEKQARIATRIPETKLAGLHLLSDIYSNQQNWSSYQRVMATMESTYGHSGEMKSACAVALKGLKTSGNKRDLSRGLEAVIARYPNCGEAFYKLSYLAESPVQAAAYAQKAVTFDGQEFKYANHLAELDLKQGKYDEAEDIYKSFLNSDTASARAFIGLANCLQSRGDQAGAILLLKNSLDKTKNAGLLWKEIGKMYSQHGSYLEAAKAYLEYADLSSNKPDGYLLAAEAYEKGGLRASARQQYEAALRIDSDNRRALRALESLRANQGDNSLQ